MTLRQLVYFLNSTTIYSFALLSVQINYISLTTGPKGPVLKVYTQGKRKNPILTPLLIVYKERDMSLSLTIRTEYGGYLNVIIVVSNYFPLFLAVLNYNNALTPLAPAYPLGFD